MTVSGRAHRCYIYPMGNWDEVLYRIEKALKPQGILYMSFKHGVFEGERNGRYFLDFTEEKLEQLLKNIQVYSSCGTF